MKFHITPDYQESNLKSNKDLKLKDQRYLDVKIINAVLFFFHNTSIKIRSCT